MSLVKTMIRVPKEELEFLKNESINISDVARKAIHEKCVKLGNVNEHKVKLAYPGNQPSGTK